MTVNVRYPRVRWEVMHTVAGLSDPEYQQRVWIRHEYPHENYFDNFDQAIHTLFDDWVVLPDAKAAIGDILVDGPEVARLATLGATLSRLIDDLSDAPDADYLAHADWPLVISQAASALSAMVLAGQLDLDWPDASG
jgi:hypothetical protein